MRPQTTNDSVGQPEPPAIAAGLILSSHRLIALASFGLASWDRFSDFLAMWIVFSQSNIDRQGLIFSVPLVAGCWPPAAAAVSVQRARAVSSILFHLSEVAFCPWHSLLGLIVELNGVTFCACIVFPNP
ncbi:hypothetical protein SAY86_017602 [Trapa natans]|uniref:Uncharacterized protein n=1 Tax=Trapa natans TaxID=22666 RepID=A0AAN7M1Z8_TRANT|nr:hypothetical protein SAY86_017602 [Trapa natans]